MNLKMLFLLLFVNMIIHCCAEKYFKNSFIIVTDIDKELLENGNWVRPNYYSYNLRDACESFRKLPRFQINQTFQDLSFNNWVGDYTIFFRRNNYSEKIDKYPTPLFVNNDLTIPSALMCYWGRSVVYITRNKSIKFGLVLFIRNENTGVQVLGVTAEFLDMKSVDNDKTSALFNERFGEKHSRKEMRDSWSTLSNYGYTPIIRFRREYQRLVWRLCASVHWNLLPHVAENKLECSFEVKSFNFPFRKLSKFLVLVIKNELLIDFEFNVFLDQPHNLFVIETQNKMLSLLKLEDEFKNIYDKITNDFNKNYYVYIDTHEA